MHLNMAFEVIIGQPVLTVELRRNHATRNPTTNT